MCVDGALSVWSMLMSGWLCAGREFVLCMLYVGCMCVVCVCCTCVVCVLYVGCLFAVSVVCLLVAHVLYVC